MVNAPEVVIIQAEFFWLQRDDQWKDPLQAKVAECEAKQLMLAHLLNAWHAAYCT